MADAKKVRIAHFSDIHVTARPLGWRPRDLLSKRVTGWMNLRIGRGRLFRDAGHIAATMMREIRQRGCQHVVFSGDATAMGFPHEMAAAASSLGLGGTEGQSVLPGLAVPGNHDYYTRAAVRSGYFERNFAAWQTGDRIGEHTYPFAQRVGPCWLIGVNTARSNFLLWDSRGQMGREQGERLRQLLARLEPGPRILVTHYPLYLADGRPEHHWRKLRDLDSLREIAIQGRISLWLHGHRHNHYFLPPKPPEQPFAIVCAGSATQLGICGWNEYAIEGTRLTMRRRSWDPATERFVDATSCEFTLPA
jgi:3',5'-cyclic AMP phosphodiesterase CpdA